MREPEGATLALESEVTRAWLGESFDFARTKPLGEGARRALRVLVSGVDARVIEAEKPNLEREQRSSVRVYFVLPKGAYATTVLSAAFSTRDGDEGDEPGAD